MKLGELFDAKWKSHERKRFLKDDTKIKTEDFDPESFKHDGFDDRKKYLDNYVDGLSDPDRIQKELTTFTPPRLGSINNSPYQALVIRYGILRLLVEQHGYSMPKRSLLERVQRWQQQLLADFHEVDTEVFRQEDPLLHLAKAAVSYGSDVDDSELHMVSSYLEMHNETAEYKHEHYRWIDFFQRLASLDRFPKVSRSEKPAHALDTIEKGAWSLQEQALVYEVVDSEEGDMVGIPEEYVDQVKNWLYFEMAEDNYLTMLESVAPFESQSKLVAARDTFGIDTKTQGYNQKRRESIVAAGIYPSELLDESLSKDELKEIVDTYGIDAHKRRRDEMVEKIIEYFEHSQQVVEDEEPEVDLFLKCYEDIADGNVEQIPPQLQRIAGNESDPNRKLDMLFEEATAEIFSESFNIDQTTLLGYTASGIVADGEIEQDGNWLLWDNKRREKAFKLGSDTQAKIKNYIDRKSEQHTVEWFLIIAPEFTNQAELNAHQLETQLGIDIRLVTAEMFVDLAQLWQSNYESDGRELPLTVFYGSGMLDMNVVTGSLERQFS